jgi:hypothetical protein
MTSSLRPFARATAPRRPCGPRCRGGASSLLRPSFGIATQRAASAAPGRRERLERGDAEIVEHIIGWPARFDRAESLSC